MGFCSSILVSSTEKKLKQANSSILRLKWPREACASDPHLTMSVFPGTENTLLRQDFFPLEAILVIFGRRALIFFV